MIDDKDKEEYIGDDQEELFDEEKATDEELVRRELDGDPCERNFTIELTLKLKRGRAYSIPLLAGEFPASRIKELIELSVNSRRNQLVIDAVLDLPKEGAEQSGLLKVA